MTLHLSSIATVLDCLYAALKGLEAAEIVSKLNDE